MIGTRDLEESMLRYSMARALDVMAPFQALRAVLHIVTRHERYHELTRYQRDAVEDALRQLPPLPCPVAPASRVEEGG